MKRIALYVLASAVVIVFLCCVYPTRYMYLDIPYSAGGGSMNFSMPVRVDRLTGTTQVLYPEGWREFSK